MGVSAEFSKFSRAGEKRQTVITRIGDVLIRVIRSAQKANKQVACRF